MGRTIFRSQRSWQYLVSSRVKLVYSRRLQEASSSSSSNNSSSSYNENDETKAEPVTRTLGQPIAIELNAFPLQTSHRPQSKSIVTS